MWNFFKPNGAIRRLTCVETPQQNAVMEQKHQHLLNVVRSLRFLSWSPSQILGRKCSYCSVHNQLAFKSTSKWSKSSSKVNQPFPDILPYACFQLSLFYSYLIRERTKFDSRAKPCIFLDYPDGIKGYLKTNKIFMSRDVFCMKTYLLFWIITPLHRLQIKTPKTLSQSPCNNHMNLTSSIKTLQNVACILLFRTSCAWTLTRSRIFQHNNWNCYPSKFYENQKGTNLLAWLSLACLPLIPVILHWSCLHNLKKTVHVIRSNHMYLIKTRLLPTYHIS